MYLGWTAVAVVYPRPSPPLPIRGRMASPRCSTLTPRKPPDGLGLLAASRQYLLLQRDRRHRDVGRPLLDDHSGDGHRGLACGEEVIGTIGWHVPHDGWSFHRLGGWRDPDCRRAHTSSRRSRSDPSSSTSRCARTHFSDQILIGVKLMETSTIRKTRPVSALLDPKIVASAIGAAFVKLDPRTLATNRVMFAWRWSPC